MPICVGLARGRFVLSHLLARMCTRRACRANACTRTGVCVSGVTRIWGHISIGASASVYSGADVRVLIQAGTIACVHVSSVRVGADSSMRTCACIYESEVRAGAHPSCTSVYKRVACVGQRL